MIFNDTEILRLTASVDSINSFMQIEDQLTSEERKRQLEHLKLSEHTNKKFFHMYYSDPKKISGLKLHIPLWNPDEIVLIANAIDAINLPMIMGLKFVNFNHVTTTRSINQIPITVYFLDSATEEDIAIAISRIDAVIAEIKLRFSLKINEGSIADSDERIGEFCSATIDHIDGYYINGSNPENVRIRQESLINSPLFANVKKLIPISAILDKINQYITIQKHKWLHEQQSFRGFLKRAFSHGFTFDEKIQAAMDLKQALINAVIENDDLLNTFIHLEERVEPLNHGRLSFIFRECFALLYTRDESVNTPTMG